MAPLPLPVTSQTEAAAKRPAAAITANEIAAEVAAVAKKVKKAETVSETQTETADSETETAKTAAPVKAMAKKGCKATKTAPVAKAKGKVVMRKPAAAAVRRSGK